MKELPRRSWGLLFRTNHQRKVALLRGLTIPIYDWTNAKHCPIFILFDDEYRPFETAVDAMIRSIFRGGLHTSRPAM